MTELGRFCEFGIGREESLEEAVACYRLAASQGDAFGQCRLAWCCEAGQGIAQSWEQAFYWYTQAAGQGNPRAMTGLYVCLREGLGTEKNEALALEYLTKAAELSYGPARWSLGCTYYFGECGQKQDYSQAKKLFLQAAKSGTMEA